MAGLPSRRCGEGGCQLLSIDERKRFGLPLSSRLAVHFSLDEIEVLADVCCVTDEDLAKLTIAQAERYLRLAYTMPQRDRRTPTRFLGHLRFLERVACVVRRCEFQWYGSDRAAITEGAATLDRVAQCVKEARCELTNPLVPPRRDGGDQS